MTYAPGIDIAVVNYHTPDDLDAFMESFVKNKPTIPFSLRIYNADPYMADIDAAFRWRTESEALSIDGPNYGYGRAVNICARRGNREVFVAFNADVKLTPGSIDVAYEHLLSREDAGVLGPYQHDSDGLCTHGPMLGINNMPKWHETGQPLGIFEVPHIMGSAYFIKRACWDELTKCRDWRNFMMEQYQRISEGAFLPTELYFEETFCSLHARHHGWKVLYDGEVELIHEWHHSVNKSFASDPQHEQWVMRKAENEYLVACAEVHGMDPNG